MPPLDRGRGDAGRGSETATYRELVHAQREILAEMASLLRPMHERIGKLEQEIAGLRAELSANQARTEWMRTIGRAILMVFGTAIGGGILYLLNLPGGKP